MKFLFLEPFYGGSHKAFADGLRAHSNHRIELATLPARFWKWRMRGAALKFIRQIDHWHDYDGLISSSLMSLSDLKAIGGPAFPPALVYFHENQLTYPLAPGEKMDYQFGFTDLTTALAADRVLFNSVSHRGAFLSKLSDFIKMMPDLRPGWAVEAIRNKSRVCYPGCRFSAGADLFDDIVPAKQGKPLVIWNHRWEFDKNPAEFFAVLETIDRQGIDFELAVLGENFQAQPKVFDAARDRLAHRIRQFGFVESRQAYLGWLKRGAVVVSTAWQENFGMAVIEAMRYGCLPLLPHRLVYPEILPDRFHEHYLYEDREDMTAKLTSILQNHSRRHADRRQLSEEMAQYAWTCRIGAFDAELENLVRASKQKMIDG